MPNEKIVLKEEEKKQIIEKHKALVDQFNNYLPDELKIKYDTNLDDKLNDEKEVKYYKTLEKIKTHLARQKEIFDELKAEKPINPDKNVLPRSIWYGFKTENSPDAKEYNRKLYNEYLEKPEKVFYQRYKKVLEFDPQKLLDCLDDKQKLADFYLENQAIIEDAFVFAASMGAPENKLNPELKSAYSGMVKMVETLSYPAGYTKANIQSDSIAMPDLSVDQIALLINANPNFMKEESPFRGAFNQKLDSSTKDKIKEAYDTVKKHGYKLGKGFYVRYQALSHDEKTNKDKEISLDDGINKLKNNPDLCVRERQPEEVKNILLINDAYEKEYSRVWQKHLSANYNKEPFDLERIKNANKGGFFERMFNTTSHEYKRFIKALEDYNDPKSENYLNKDDLKDKASAYFDYKTSDGVSFSKLNETERNRLALAASVVRTITEMENEKEKVDAEIFGNLEPSEIEKEPLLDKDVVEDNFIDNNIEQDNNVIKKENELNL
jgi:hypothetical protein